MAAYLILGDKNNLFNHNMVEITAFSRGPGSDSGTARPQAVEDVSHHLRAQYDLRERGDEDWENPRGEYGVEASVSGAAQCLTGQVAHAERGQPLFTALLARRGVEWQPPVGLK